MFDMRKSQEKPDPNRHYIPAKEKADIYAAGHIFRTCAYCRVSTDSDMQLSSFELQNEHYRNLAGAHPNWDLRKIYADEGISGTSLKNRDQFNEMLKACENGEYDLILTKSVSRFARNLVDCVSLVRELKNHRPPIGVFFETDNLYTLSEDSELKLSLLATFAQEESVKKSESMVWSLQERFKTERLLMPECLGYTREKDAAGRFVKGAKLQIVEKEALIVRFIYDAFLAGYPMISIAEILTEIGVPTKTGKEGWNEGSIHYILTNERYCGNVLTWKTFTADIFEHKKRRNNQDRDQYLYTNVHEAIIPVQKFEAVQMLLSNKKHHVRSLPQMHVIDDGIFRGFVPVNHHWVNDDPNTYYEASNSVALSSRLRRFKRSDFGAFDFGGYQVIRGQIMMVRAECPCITISRKRISFNRECQRKFNDVGYVQLLIHPAERKIAIRPCEEEDAHCIRWRLSTERPFCSKVINCPYFSSALYQIMGWQPEYQYKVRGTWVQRGQDQIIVFDISNAIPVATLEKQTSANSGAAKRVDLYPEEWGDTFGMEYYDFIFHNAFYYINPCSDWKAKAKSHVASGADQVKIPTRDDLQTALKTIQLRMEHIYGE